MSKVNLDTIKPWITSRVTELLNFEDDVVTEFIYNQLDERVMHYLSQGFFYDIAMSTFKGKTVQSYLG